jgi:hypothetical protein
LFSSSGSAAAVYLNDWCFNDNGNTSVCNGSSPNNQATFDATLSNVDTKPNNLGSVSFSLASGQFAGLYTQYDLSPIFTNDYAKVSGGVPSGASFEITDLNNPANYDGLGNALIWNDFGITASKFALNDVNGALTPGFAPNACCEVAGSIFWLEELSCGSTVGTPGTPCPAPAGSPIFLSETFTPNTTPPTGVPEPATAILVIPAVALLMGIKRLKAAK